MSKTVIIFAHQMARNLAHKAIDDAPDNYMMILTEKTRTLEQNSLLWAMLTDVSRQVEWYGRWLTPEDWKHIFSAALHKQDVVPNLDGSGFVILGQSTSKMTKKEFSDLVELIRAFGAERGVKWTNEQSTYSVQTRIGRDRMRVV